jgi:hypothetical protein
MPSAHRNLTPISRTGFILKFAVRPVLAGLLAAVLVSAWSDNHTTTTALSGGAEIAALAPTAPTPTTPKPREIWVAPAESTPTPAPRPVIEIPEVEPIVVEIKPIVVKTAPSADDPATYTGTYRIWIPALGINQAIHDWGCNGGLIPNRVEYWGCAEANNLYLLGHAWGVFKPIHDGYHTGALRVGLAVWYADKSGLTHRYRVSEIRHVVTAAYDDWIDWATGAMPGPTITLQTCDGAGNEYRILVRILPD